MARNPKDNAQNGLFKLIEKFMNIIDRNTLSQFCNALSGDVYFSLNESATPLQVITPLNTFKPAK